MISNFAVLDLTKILLLELISPVPASTPHSKVGDPLIVVFKEPVVETIARTISEVLEQGLAASFLTISESYRSKFAPEHPRFCGRLQSWPTQEEAY